MTLGLFVAKTRSRSGMDESVSAKLRQQLDRDALPYRCMVN
jgi:hypothetical protein